MNKEIRPISYNGELYFTKKQVCQLTGYTLSRLNQKIADGLDLKTVKLPNGRCLCSKEAVDDAISNGALVKGLNIG